MPTSRSDAALMIEAISQARRSRDEGGIPIGAALVDGDGVVLGTGHNERVQKGDPIAHGEIACLRNAGRRRSYRDCTLFTTLAPCAMCTGAVLLFKIPRVVVGESTTFPGELDVLRAAGVEVVLLDDPECIALMRDFIAESPELWNEDISV